MNSVIRGPEQATLVERFVGFVPLPYVGGAAVLAAVAGILTYAALPLEPRELNSLTGSLTIFYFLSAIRYIRLRVVSSERELLQLLPEGEETWHRIFGRISSPIAPIGLAALLDIPVFTLAYQAFQRPGGLSLAVLVFANALLIGGFGAIIWVYVTSLWGLHRLGREPLRLKSIYEDRMMGLRPVGSLCLSFVFVYLGALGLGSALAVIQRLESALSFTFVVLLIGLSLALFFLPLMSVHSQMLAAKQRELSSVRKELMRIVSSSNPNSESTDTELGLLRDLKAQLTLESAERRIASAPSWPIDFGIFGRLLAIILTFTEIMLARIAQNLLGL